VTLVTEPVNVYQAIRASRCGIAERMNRNTKRVEYAKKTINGIRIIKSFTDPTIVRSLSPAQELTRGWTPVDPKPPAKLPDAHVTRDLLLLVGLKVPLVVIRDWSGWEREQAERWASACIARASDNTHVRIAPRPRCLAAYKEERA
jgi:hypothetical protein